MSHRCFSCLFPELNRFVILIRILHRQYEPVSFFRLSGLSVTRRQTMQQDQFYFKSVYTVVVPTGFIFLESFEIWNGIFNLVAETVAMMAVFASRRFDCHDIILTGNLTVIDPIRTVFESLGPAFDVRFLIPDNSRFGTVIGAALQ